MSLFLFQKSGPIILTSEPAMGAEGITIFSLMFFFNILIYLLNVY